MPTNTPTNTPTPPSCTTCLLGYPDNSNPPRSQVVFNESEVLRAFDPAQGCITSADGKVKLWYNDEHALTLGVRRVIVKERRCIGGANVGNLCISDSDCPKSKCGSAVTTTTDYPVSPLTANPGHVSNLSNPPLATGTNDLDGDQAGTDTNSCSGSPDLCDRPMWPSLFVTDITFNANDRSGDWQFGGVPNNPSDVFGTWKAAVRTVDKTKSPAAITVTPDGDPAKNNWNLGTDSDTPPGGFGSLTNQGWGAEVRWNLSVLHDNNGQALMPGHLYRLQFMVHDGDQNKTGGDTGEACTDALIPFPSSFVTNVPHSGQYVQARADSARNGVLPVHEVLGRDGHVFVADQGRRDDHDPQGSSARTSWTTRAGPTRSAGPTGTSSGTRRVPRS